MKRKRKNYTPEEKVAILKRHLVDKVVVSDLCNEYHLQPTVFYRWQKEFFENGASSNIHYPAQAQLPKNRIDLSKQQRCYFHPQHCNLSHQYLT